jgi:fumarylacetoacetase
VLAWAAQAVLTVTGATQTSWVASANGHADFPIQNLPYGVFSPTGAGPRGGVAIGDEILDLGAALDAGLLSGDAAVAAEAGRGPTLNALLGLGAAKHAALRTSLAVLLSADAPATPQGLLHRAADCTVHLPAAIGDYTDFYAGIAHALNAGRLLRPDNPLMPNYKFIPVAYHGRASSVRPSGVPVRRPGGQLKPAGDAPPAYGSCQNLDYEMELGVWIGPGNALGEPIPVDAAHRHIAGFCLLNDWSARDIQRWEYQPLGPFLGKNFHTTISPWIVTPEALAPFRIPQPPRTDGDPAPLPHLWSESDQRTGALDLELEVLIGSSTMRARGMAPHRLSIGNARHLYWTVAQMVTHHSSGGCNLQPGDLLGTGTISSPEEAGWGSLLELSMGGRREIELPSGEKRRFLEDGDEIILRARARRAGFAPIGFGDCRATVTGGS